MIELKILNKELYEEFGLPKYATEGSAAIDLICPYAVYLTPGARCTLFTGLSLHIGSGYANTCAILSPRSSLGKQGLMLSNTIGLIDEDYQGELIIECFTSYSNVSIDRGDRFAQLVFLPIIKPEFKVVEQFNTNTQRGVGGFGSSGR